MAVDDRSPPDPRYPTALAPPGTPHASVSTTLAPHAPHLLAVHLDVGHVVLEDGGHVDLGELVFAEDDEQTGLPARAVAHDHQLLTDRRHLCHERVPRRYPPPPGETRGPRLYFTTKSQSGTLITFMHN